MLKGIDQKLAKLYNEYVENGNEPEFINMLTYILDHSPETARRKAEKEREKQLKISERNEKRKTAQQIKDSMTAKERIEFLNTPFVEIPDELRDDKLVMHPQELNFVRFADPQAGLQKETFAARLIRYMDSHGFTTTDPDTGSMKIDAIRFSDVCNEFAKDFDTKARKGHRPQKTRITPLDISNYTNWNITPKIDKLTIISEAMGVDIEYLSGYRGSIPPKSGEYNAPFGGGPLGTKFRKRRCAKQ